MYVLAASCLGHRHLGVVHLHPQPAIFERLRTHAARPTPAQNPTIHKPVSQKRWNCPVKFQDETMAAVALAADQTARRTAASVINSAELCPGRFLVVRLREASQCQTAAAGTVMAHWTPCATVFSSLCRRTADRAQPAWSLPQRPDLAPPPLSRPAVDGRQNQSIESICQCGPWASAGQNIIRRGSDLKRSEHDRWRCGGRRACHTALPGLALHCRQPLLDCQTTPCLNRLEQVAAAAGVRGAHGGCSRSEAFRGAPSALCSPPGAL